MDANTLRQTLLEELESYTGQGLNDFAFLTSNDVEQIYSIIDIATVGNKRIVGTVLVARLIDQNIVIEIDRHDKTLAEALLERGVPESQIILTYRGDTIPA